MQVTIATQQAMLEGLSDAREDDDIIDFSPCIKAADRGRSEALIILHSYFLRKEREEEERAAMSRSHSDTSAGLSPDAQPLRPQTTVAQPAERMIGATANPGQSNPPPPPLGPKESEIPKTFWRRLTTPLTLPSNQPKSPHQNALIRDSVSEHPTHIRTTSDESHKRSRPHTSPPLYAERQSTSSTDSTDPTTSSLASGSSPSITSPSRTVGYFSSSISPITSYGGCCKYAHRLRDGIGEALMLQNLAITPGAQNYHYVCSSVKCAFRGPAIPNGRRRWMVDNRIRSWKGFQYRWLFLAKSHMQQIKPEDGHQFRCIICVLLGDQSSVFQGEGALLEHVISHQGAQVNDITLVGPLSFSNDGIRVDDEFDINLPEISSPRASPLVEPPPAAYVVDTQTKPRESVGSSNRSSILTDELEQNHWDE
jgi:hypothetical protein